MVHELRNWSQVMGRAGGRAAALFRGVPPLPWGLPILGFYLGPLSNGQV
jgi:hypothetical protein